MNASSYYRPWRAAVLVVLLAVGGWFLYWKLTAVSVNNRYQVNTHSQEYQGMLTDKAESYYQGWQSDEQAQAADPGNPQWAAQEVAEQRQFCAVYANLTQPPADLALDARQLSC